MNAMTKSLKLAAVLAATLVATASVKAEIGQWFDPGEDRRLSISVQSFSYKRGLPRGWTWCLTAVS